MRKLYEFSQFPHKNAVICFSAEYMVELCGYFYFFLTSDGFWG